MKKKNTILYILAFAIGVTVLAVSMIMLSAGKSRNNADTAGGSNVRQVTAAEFDTIAAQENAFVLDVHTPEQTHIPGTDAFIPFDDIAGHASELPADKSMPILVYCRSGSMSKTASEELVRMGYTDVYDLIGGTDVYKTSASQVSVSPERTDLGTVMYGDVPTTQLTMTNYSPDTITVTRVSTSCGCTTASMEEKTLEPYSSAIVDVVFNPAVHGDDTDLGELTRTIYIDTDHPDYPQVTAALTANVVKE